MKAIVVLLSLMAGVVLVICISREAADLQYMPTQVASVADASTEGIPDIQAEPTPDLLSIPQAALTRLTQAGAFRIENDWSGLSPIAPIEAHYDLRLQDRSFIGKANFSVGGYIKEHTALEDVSIPEDVALDFLRMLAQSPLEQSKYARGYGPEYEPLIGHTDDYPSIDIWIESNNETIRFFTGSQGEDHVPWGLEFKGKIYIINASQPMNALRLLMPYLKLDKLEKLKDEAWADFIGMPTTGAQDAQP